MITRDKYGSSFQRVDKWFKGPQGQRISSAFVDELRPLKDQLRGQVMVQLGFCGDNKWLSTFQYRHQWIISPVAIRNKNTLVCELNHLPFERDSIDCIVAPFSMEMCTAENNPLDEMDRVLKPFGHLVFFGVNPFSLWGAALRFGLFNGFEHIKAHPRSALILKRHVLERGYNQCLFSSFYYIPPVEHPFWIKKLEFLNEMSKMLWPCPAGFYCFVAQKYDYAFLPLRPSQQTLMCH